MSKDDSYRLRDRSVFLVVARSEAGPLFHHWGGWLAFVLIYAHTGFAAISAAHALATAPRYVGPAQARQSSIPSNWTSDKAASGVDPCEALADRCGNCANELDKMTCELTVQWDVPEGCQNALDDATIAETCPE